MPRRLTEMPPVIGAMSPNEAGPKLSEVGEEIGTAQSFSALDFLPWRRKLWASTTHAFGYLAPAPPGSDLLPITDPGVVNADPTLRDARVRITLDRFRVAQYPGGGTHTVLFDFSGRTQGDGNSEDLHFNAVYRVREGESVGVIGFPIFVGLPVGGDGLGLRCYTVNVRNDQDESLLSFLESNTFRAGLRLVKTVQPALGPLSAMALGLTKAVAIRARNVPVQDFYLGLDFGTRPLGARLAEGNYLAVQVPEEEMTTWDWSRWVYSSRSGQVIGAGQERQLLPYNYVVFGITRCHET